VRCAGRCRYSTSSTIIRYNPGIVIAQENGFWHVLRACTEADVLSVIVAARDKASPGLAVHSFR
jgi:hypothetical protein